MFCTAPGASRQRDMISFLIAAVIVFAGVTSEKQGFHVLKELSRIRVDASFLLMSRASVVDFSVLVELVRAGRFQAATDVFPVEPVAKDDPMRNVEGILLSAHRIVACELCSMILAPGSCRCGAHLKRFATCRLPQSASRDGEAFSQ